MSEHTPKTDRHEWIESRARVGYDFTDLVRALSRLEVEATDDGLLIDMSAFFEDTYYPTHHLLVDEEDGTWTHDGSGETGALMDHLMAAATFAVEKAAPATWVEVDIPTKRKKEPKLKTGTAGVIPIAWATCPHCGAKYDEGNPHAAFSHRIRDCKEVSP